ncbi:MAG: TlpA disulfide reductase family protein [Xanthomonadales bacterium]|jgi:thiol-disulfide isomerase/thioredoxin|nr:TlpA disulfide reductase family protein [Xanthomonadales bacterium]
MNIIAPALLALALLLPVGPAAADDTTPVDFELEQLDGGTLSIADLRGQWVVINYWATWCAPCRKEIPDLSELHERADHISVVGIAYEETEPEVFREFLAEFSPSYPNLLVDVYNPPQPFGAPMALPTSILLNPAGIPVKTYVGPVTGVEIEEFIADSERG